MGGDFLGSIDSAGSLTDAQGNWDGRIEIGGDLVGDIALGAAGLVGQVIINSANNASQWLGDVTVGTTILGPTQPPTFLAPYYEEPSGNLGGGAVGLVTFNFHKKDSNPVHGVSVITGTPTSVSIHHYGPVADGDNDPVTTPPVRVFEANLILPWGSPPHPPHEDTPICGTSVPPYSNIWTEVTTGLSHSVSGRIVTITNDTQTFSSNRAYQIIPADLVCDDVTNSPAVVYVSDWVGTQGCTGEDDTDGYGFKVASGFDLNRNLAFDIGDIETWIASPVDLDSDTDADALDLILLVDVVTTGIGE